MTKKLLVENYICHICNKLASIDCIYCELCNTWLHRTCLKLSQKCLRILGASPYPHFCPPCFQPTLPFSTLTNKTFQTIIKQHGKIKDAEKISCNFCDKTIRCNQIKVKCSLCFKPVHQYCLGAIDFRFSNFLAAFGR